MSEADDVTRLPNGWSLVRAGTWEVSIAPDGLIMLPRHVQPDEVDDFVAAMVRAAEVGAAQQAAILSGQAELPAAQSSIVVTDASTQRPKGAVPLRGKPRQGR